MESTQECIRSGSLEVQSPETNDWNTYFFRLIGHSKDDVILEYYENNTSETPIDSIKLQGCTIYSAKEMLQIQSPKTILFLCSENERIALSWEHILRDVIDGSYFVEEGSADSDLEGERSDDDESDEELIYCPINSALAYNKYNIFNKVKDFSRYFIDKGILYLNKKALHKGLDNCSVRSIYWKVMLGILPQDSPPSSWPAVLSMLRVKYNELKKEYLLNPEDITRSSSSKHISNPEDDEEIGNYLFETQQLELTIRKDITRTFSSFTFFQEPNVQDLFVRVLMVTSKMRKDIGYQQGLSEILAVIFFLLYIERIEGSNLGRLDVMGDEYGATSGISCNSYLSRAEKEEIDQEILGIRYATLPSSKNIKNKIPEDQKDTLELLYVLMNGDFIEHDAFLLLNSMIDRMANIYAPVNEQAKSALFLANKLADLQSRLLRTIDPDVTDALEENDITGHMYLLKWIRILFAREFRMPCVWTLWDAIFTLTPDDFSLDNYICLAMLEEVRDDICVEDTAGILKLLKNSFEEYPIRDVIDKALEYEEQLGQITPTIDMDDEVSSYDSNDDYDEDGVRKWKDGDEDNDVDDNNDEDEREIMTSEQHRTMRSSFSFSFQEVDDIEENV